MPIFLNSSSRIICQGTLSEEQEFGLHQAISYGTKIVAFVQPGQGGSALLNLPVFNTVREAVKQTRADSSIIYTDKEAACNDIVEAIDSDIPLVISLANSMPVHDIVEVTEMLQRHPKSRFLGPRLFCLVTPGQCKIGAVPGFVFSPGPIGYIMYEDSLGSAIAMHCSKEGLGQSTCIGLQRGDFEGMNVLAIAEKFYADEQTEVILYVADTSQELLRKTVDIQEKCGKKPMVIYSPGSGLEDYESQKLSIVRDMMQIPIAIKKYLKTKAIQETSPVVQEV